MDYLQCEECYEVLQRLDTTVAELWEYTEVETEILRYLSKLKNCIECGDCGQVIDKEDDFEVDFSTRYPGNYFYHL